MIFVFATRLKRNWLQRRLAMTTRRQMSRSNTLPPLAGCATMPTCSIGRTQPQSRGVQAQTLQRCPLHHLHGTSCVMSKTGSARGPPFLFLRSFEAMRVSLCGAEAPARCLFLHLLALPELDCAILAGSAGPRRPPRGPPRLPSWQVHPVPRPQVCASAVKAEAGPQVPPEMRVFLATRPWACCPAATQFCSRRAQVNMHNAVPIARQGACFAAIQGLTRARFLVRLACRG